MNEKIKLTKEQWKDFYARQEWMAKEQEMLNTAREQLKVLQDKVAAMKAEGKKGKAIDDFVKKMKQAEKNQSEYEKDLATQLQALKEIRDSVDGISLTDEEEKLLASFNNKMESIMDYTQSVALGLQTGFFLSGSGGTGKSFTVMKTLEDLKRQYKLHNTSITAKGLMQELEQTPTIVHVIEDAETVLADKKSWQLLRSALWATGNKSKEIPMPRLITWTANKENTRFIFTGGIIILSNRDLSSNVPEVAAGATRIITCKIDVKNEEILALSKKLCLNGDKYGEWYMTPAECMEVRQFVIDQLSALKARMDIRLVEKGFKLYIQHREGKSIKHWKDLLLGAMSGNIEQDKYVPQRDVKDNQGEIARRLLADKAMTRAARVAEWKQLTGLSEPALYRLAKRG